jgi:hypothetical protein
MTMCANCRFWGRIETGSMFPQPPAEHHPGYCQRHAPVLIGRPYPTLSAFPQMPASGVCGEHQAAGAVASPEAYPVTTVRPAAVAGPTQTVDSLTDLLISLYSNPNATPRRSMYEADARKILQHVLPQSGAFPLLDTKSTETKL